MPSSDFRFSPRPNKAHTIEWREWGDAAFEQAKADGKPVLLSISAVWCHWCHVMDETSYSDDEVIDRINQHFVPIRVDNDRRPDINARYNQGGWPTTAFLTAEGEILAGATYLPAERMRGVLDQMRDYYSTSAAEISQKVAEIRARREATAPRSGESTQPDETLVTATVESIRSAYDATYGGLGNEPKFPHPEAFNLLLDQYVRTGDLALLHMVTNTLDQMRSRGIWDKVEGGFFRYSTTKDWEIPHFEKMLEGEAGLLRNYLYAYRVTGEASYLDTARSLMAYLNRTLFDQERSFFYGSQDADEHYFAQPKEERAKLEAPFVDPTLYVNWNAQMVSSYLEAAWTMDDPIALEQALRVLVFLWETCRDNEGGMLHYYDGEAKVSGLLTDQVAVALALLDAHDATGDRSHLERALTLAQVILEGYADADASGFFDLKSEHDTLGNLQFRTKNIDENAAAADVFKRLERLLGEPAFGELSASAMAAFADGPQHYGYFASGFARTYLRTSLEPVEAHIVGDPSLPATRALLWGTLRLKQLAKVVMVLDPSDEDELEEFGYPPTPAPAVYICYAGTCSAPVQTLEHLAAAAESTAAPFRALS